MRSGALERERVVHFETWAMEAVAAAAGVTTPLPMGPFPERALRPLLADTSGLDRAGGRARGGRRGAARRASPPRSTSSTASFEAVTGRAAARGDGDSGGGRTVAYLDCMRDLELTLGPAVLDELRDLAAARCSTRRAGGAGACSTAARRCSARIAQGARARSRRCSAS